METKWRKSKTSLSDLRNTRATDIKEHHPRSVPNNNDCWCLKSRQINYGFLRHGIPLLEWTALSWVNRAVTARHGGTVHGTCFLASILLFQITCWGWKLFFIIILWPWIKCLVSYCLAVWIGQIQVWTGNDNLWFYCTFFFIFKFCTAHRFRHGSYQVLGMGVVNRISEYPKVS